MKSTKYKHDPRKLCGNPAYHYGWENDGLPCWMCNKVEEENKADELTAANQRIKELEETIQKVANNIAGSPATIIEWSKKVGEALVELDRLQQALSKEDSFKRKIVP